MTVIDSPTKVADREDAFTNELSRELWLENYKYYKENTIDESFRRVAKAIASVEETDEKKQEWEEKFYDLLNNFKITAAGRIFANAGTDRRGVTLMNCFVGPRPKYDIDSLDGIYETLRMQGQTLKSEGGWGMNFSFIRPRGSFIYGVGVETPGAVKYMEIFDKSSEIITAGSGRKIKKKEGKIKIRKGAMMAVLDVWHPDVIEFIKAKQKKDYLSKFNVSVNCSNEFMEKVIKCVELKKGGVDPAVINAEHRWNFVFPDTTHPEFKAEWDGNIKRWLSLGYTVNNYGDIGVLELWDLITSSTYKRNEPGVMFCDIANKTHCWNYGGQKAHIAASNPCGEQTMPFGSICDLASKNLTQFVDVKNGCFDLPKVAKYAKYLVRFLDNVITYTNLPLEEYSYFAINSRRIGIGVMGWGSALYMLKTRFASDKAESIKHDLMKTLTHAAVEASIDLAEEKGMFSWCEPEKHAQAPFWDQIELPQALRDRMARVGIRNSSLFSIQPTGNTGVLANLASGGGEPVFLPEYIRTVIVNFIPDHIKDKCPDFNKGDLHETEMFKWHKEGDEQILRGVDENGVVYKIDRNRGLTKEVLCEDYGVRYLKSIGQWNPDADWAVTTTSLSTEEHIKDMQGFAKWLDAAMSKTINLPNDYPFDEFQDVYLNAYKTGHIKGVTTYRAGTMTSVLSEVGTKLVESKERPKDVPCDVFHITVKGQEYFIFVGIVDGKPYEMFGGKNGHIDKSIKKGVITKIRSHYKMTFDDGSEIANIGNDMTDTEEALARLISLSLRNGVPIVDIVKQLERTDGLVYDFSKSICRALKKYIVDGTKDGDRCPNCDAELVRESGCSICKNCDWSKC